MSKKKGGITIPGFGIATDEYFSNMENIINVAFERRNEITPATASSGDIEVKYAVDFVIKCLDNGILRVAEKNKIAVTSDLPGDWESFHEKWFTVQWVKKAVLLSFRVYGNQIIHSGIGVKFYDKVPSKFANYGYADFEDGGFRVVPPATVRKGAFIGKNVVLMPSFVNTGAYVDEGTMVDTWATVGSCAQIGKNVHLSGGVGIGGVLEPLQDNPTIIEDNCFIGARSEVCEGVVVGAWSVLSMGVFIGKNTPIVNRLNGNEIIRGEVPPHSVVIMGVHPKNGLICPHIVKLRDEKTDAATILNELLRGD